MKKTYTLILSFFIGIITTFGQVNMTKPEMINVNTPYQTQIKFTNNKTINCIDTVRYPQSKLTGLPEIDPTPMDYLTYIGAVSQAFHFTGNGTVNGISAYILLDLDGVPFNASPIIMTIKVYNIDANNYPTTLIDSSVVQVIDVGFQEQTLMFSSPVAVSDSFAVAYEINPSFPSNPYYVTNTSANSDGNGEQLSCVTSTGTWFNAFLDFGGWDTDLMIAPIMEQSFTASFTEDTFNTCLGQPVTFTNTSNMNTDTMFNLMTGPLYSWNYDDGTGIYNHLDTTYTFGSPGFYKPTLFANYYGYNGVCIDSVTYPVVPNVYILVADTSATANFGYTDTGGGNFQFTDSSIVAGSAAYSWTFQGGAPATSNMSNPLINFTVPGMHQVCLTVFDSTGCATDMFCDSISFTVGIDDYYAADFVKVYPIPANKFFNVSVPENYFGGVVVLTDVVGQQLKSVAIENQELIKVTTEGIATGIYFVSIEYKGDRVFAKRIIIDK